MHGSIGEEIGSASVLAEPPANADVRARGLLTLRSAIVNDIDPGHRVEHAATLRLLDRAERAAAGSYGPGWDLFAAAAPRLIGDDGWGLRVGVMANMLALVELADAEDYTTFDDLVERHGADMIASVQATVDGLLGSGPAMPLATRVVVSLAPTISITALLVAAGHDRAVAAGIARRCFQAGFRLVMTGVDPAAPGPRITTMDEIAACYRGSGGIQAWRGQVAIIAANPWDPYVGALKALATAAHRSVFVAVIDRADQVYRERFERLEREQVGKEIRRLVAVSGFSQRDFAARIGTSAPRLSTYVNGTVTPAATMMLRIKRVSKRAEEARRRPADSRRTG